MLYLDNASTYHPKPDVVHRSIKSFIQNIGASPGRGSYKSSLVASELVKDTRKKLGSLFGIEDYNLISFANNATGAINLGIKGFLKENDHALICDNSHNSVVRPLEDLMFKCLSLEVSHVILFVLILEEK